ncbi:39S ribosomal protein L21, mitochondrial [Sciurus carolinensis]|uniref:Large ribosomal subunit protein bL21m n=1 Tax=Sciurus carolinensis TaxID=30640 RepID=A0AA41NF11_SCICA|nr:39S ribosomal protein L21, mitochondrial [Sciurus carolinensis]
MKCFHRYVPKTSLSSPPWPEIVLPDPVEETRHHTDIVRKVNELIATNQYGRLFAVVHFASHQWKVTSEDLILIHNELDVKCGERIRLEKGLQVSSCSGDSDKPVADAPAYLFQVLLVGADNFTLVGKPLLGKDLVRIEATVIEKTESWPKINMKFKKRKNFRKKRMSITRADKALRTAGEETSYCNSVKRRRQREEPTDREVMRGIAHAGVSHK